MTSSQKQPLSDKANTAPRKFQFKIVLLGDASVGKSCLVVRFAKNEFFQNQEPTIGAAFMTQSVQLQNSVVHFEIWDTAGAERYRSLAPMYYRGAAAALVVYDITSKDSFVGAKAWIHELLNIYTADILIVLIGNKSDLSANRAIDSDMAKTYAEKNNLLFFETSAKTGQNVFEVFRDIARELPKRVKEQDSNSGFQLSKNETGGNDGSDKTKGNLWSCCFPA